MCHRDDPAGREQDDPARPLIASTDQEDPRPQSPTAPVEGLVACCRSPDPTEAGLLAGRLSVHGIGAVAEPDDTPDLGRPGFRIIGPG